MTALRFKNKVDGEFGMVPRALWHSSLSVQAKAIAAYLCCVKGDRAPSGGEIERDLGIGRDARRKAMAALEAVEFLQWEVERAPGGTFITRWLTIDPLAFVLADRAAAAAKAGVSYLAPENQAAGQINDLDEGGDLAPDLPAGGFSVGPEVESPPSSDVKSGGQERDKIQEKRDRAANARAVADRVDRTLRLPDWCPPISSWSSFQKACIREDKSVFFGDGAARRLVEQGTRDMSRLRALLRSVDA